MELSEIEPPEDDVVAETADGGDAVEPKYTKLRPDLQDSDLVLENTEERCEATPIVHSRRQADQPAHLSDIVSGSTAQRRRSYRSASFPNRIRQPFSSRPHHLLLITTRASRSAAVSYASATSSGSRAGSSYASRPPKEEALDRVSSSASRRAGTARCRGGGGKCARRAGPPARRPKAGQAQFLTGSAKQSLRAQRRLTRHRRANSEKRQHQPKKQSRRSRSRPTFPWRARVMNATLLPRHPSGAPSQGSAIMWGEKSHAEHKRRS